MLKMVKIEDIRKKHLMQGWSIRRIARELNVSRQVIRKALQSAEIPAYQPGRRNPSPILAPFLPLIERWLEDDEKAPRKQRHTARRIYHRLVDEAGFRGSEPTVRRAVARLKDRQREAFIPLTADWGEVAEVDWGQATIFYGQDPVVLWLFCLKLRRSGVPFVRAYWKDNLESFLDAQVEAFAWLGGVPRVMRYDNLSSAVTRVLLGPLREVNSHFSSLRAHYLFDSLFCRPGKGNEKGSVENLVGTVRRNALTPVPQVCSLEELNVLLLDWCEEEKGKRQRDWLEERAALRPLPPYPFRPAIPHPRQVNGMSLVCFEGNRYSVPCRLVHRPVLLWAFHDHLEIFAQEECVAVHPRSRGRGTISCAFPHILPAIRRKPRSVLHAQAVRDLPEPFQRARRQLEKESPLGYREFTKILLLTETWSMGSLARALEEAIQAGALNSAHVHRLLLGQGKTTILPLLPPSPDFPHGGSSLLDLRLPQPDLGCYDELWEQSPSLFPIALPVLATSGGEI
ncbi:MAG: IS21 family transposase [Chloroflexi bacterium]|nr:IS21 family transposase [Chloroflexota bacterium]